MIATKELIVKWNQRLPLDYHFRKYFGLIFNSDEHRKLSVWSARHWYIESQYVKDEKERLEEETKAAASAFEKEFDDMSLDKLETLAKTLVKDGGPTEER